MITKVKKPKMLNIAPSFSQLSLTDFGKEYIKTQLFEEQVSFGLWNALGGWDGNDVQVRWYIENGECRLRVLEQSDLEQQREKHASIFIVLDEPTTTPEILRQTLLQAGYADITYF